MERQNTGPEKGHLDGINETVRTDTNAVCVPDFLLRINVALMRYLWLVGRVHTVERSCRCSRAFATAPPSLLGCCDATCVSAHIHCNDKHYVQAKSNLAVGKTCGSAARNVPVLLCIILRHISDVMCFKEEGVSAT
jgi:hypothetical protein